MKPPGVQPIRRDLRFLVGDSLYGGPEAPRIMLHALAVIIEGRRIEAPIPSGFGEDEQRV